MTETLIMANVVSNAALSFPDPNMEPSIFHAVEKSAALKNTQVTFTKKNVHIHIPEGAVPKDGPSAGITLMTALASSFTGRKVKPYLAMTGEITLRGQVLPVGGIKEKVLAAKRSGLKELIMCIQNEKDVNEINPNFIKGLKVNYVKTMQQVLELALS